MDIVGTGMYELELQCSGKALVKGEGGFEAAIVGFFRVEFGSEFLYSNGGDGQFLSTDLGE